MKTLDAMRSSAKKITYITQEYIDELSYSIDEIETHDYIDADTSYEMYQIAEKTDILIQNMLIFISELRKRSDYIKMGG